MRPRGPRRRDGRDPAAPGRRPPPSEEISPAARELARVLGDSTRDAEIAMSLAAHGAPLFTTGPGLARASRTRPYEPQPGDPPLRALRVFAHAPEDGVVATVRIPWEPLAPGPAGGVLTIEVATPDGAPVDLESPLPVAYAGYAPATGDRRYVAQLCYAAAAGTWHRWRDALGRDPAWGFDRGGDPDASLRLHVRVPADARDGARYEAITGTVVVRASAGDGMDTGRPLAHDDVARAVSIAILHGLRPHFDLPTNADVLSLRDGLASLVATLLRATWVEAGRATLRAALCDGGAEAQSIAALGARLAARSMGAHGSGGGADRASLLVDAVWDAFAAVWARRALPAVRLATGDEVISPAACGDLLLDALADVASSTARQLLGICVRAVDYLPPVDATFGDWLRAAITADRELVPDDRWRYREALVIACERRGIAPHHAGVADTEALAWPAPARVIPPLRGLDFATMQFEGDPAHAPSVEEMERQATVLGRIVAHPQWCELFGLADPSRPDHRAHLDGDEVTLPCIESVRAVRRAGPHGRVIFEIVAEVTQRRTVRGGRGAPSLEIPGGATIIAAPSGEVHWIVARSVLDPERIERLRAWALGDGARGWTAGTDGVLRPWMEEYEEAPTR